jgi:hypothetical protein
MYISVSSSSVSLSNNLRAIVNWLVYKCKWLLSLEDMTLANNLEKQIF